MKLKVGIIGLLIILVVVLAMTRQYPYLTREGYADVDVISSIIIFGIIGVMALIGAVMWAMDSASKTANAGFSNLAKNLGNLSNK